MHVLFMSGSAELGGAERSMLDIIASLQRAHPSWRLELLCPAEGPLVEAAATAGARAEVLPFGPALARLGEAGGPDGKERPFAARLAGAVPPLARYARRLRARLKSLAPDVVHTHGMKAHLLAAWANPGPAAVVWHLHDYLGRRPSSTTLLKRSLARCAAIVANSESVAADAREMLGGRTPIATVLNAVDLDRFSPDGPQAQLDAVPGCLPSGAVRVGLVATFARWKGHTTFLDACARLPERVHAYVIGGPLYETEHSQLSIDALRAHVGRLGIGHRVTFTGFVRDSAAAMRALDIVVHASVDPEPFGLVIAEAMACGRAVVVADAGGARELITPGLDAVTHDPGDASSLARAIAELAGDAPRRSRLGAAAREAAIRRFDRGRLAQELAPIYHRVAAGQACA